jgi:hypothetical protein
MSTALLVTMAFQKSVEMTILLFKISISNRPIGLNDLNFEYLHWVDHPV